jgi:hypothetical protein
MSPQGMAEATEKWSKIRIPTDNVGLTLLLNSLLTASEQEIITGLRDKLGAQWTIDQNTSFRSGPKGPTQRLVWGAYRPGPPMEIVFDLVSDGGGRPDGGNADLLRGLGQ